MRLSTGEVAVVVKAMRGLARYPLVKVLLDAEGCRVEPYESSLAERQDVVITEVIPRGPDASPPGRRGAALLNDMTPERSIRRRVLL